MTHNEVYKQFELYFKQYSGVNNVEVWFPNGKNSIRIRQKNKQEYIFTYTNPKEWKLETKDSFLNHIKK